MNRASAAVLGLLLVLVGCPLPQPLADYPKGTVTPPRILMDTLPSRDTVVRVPAACPGTAPAFELAAVLVDNNSTESVTARWFVDYDRQNSARCVPAVPQSVIEGPGDGAADPTRREVPAYRFAPYDHLPVIGTGTGANGPGVVHVVELVVSNQFDSTADDAGRCTAGAAADSYPFRSPASAQGVLFETQTYRWVFVTEAASTEVPCP